MEISSAHHHQAMGSHIQLEEALNCPKAQQQQHQQERRLRPQPEQALKCPRCDSTNTKFCYYNNYSLSQPRYFCKGCRRYWTQGGSLRNVPVGGGCRKNNKRSTNTSSSSSTTSSSSSSSKRAQDHNQDITTINNPTPQLLLPSLTLPPPLSYDPSDLTLAFASLHSQQMDHPDHHQQTFLLENPNHGFLDILKSGAPSDHIHQSLYYGFSGNGCSVEDQGGGGRADGDGLMMFPFDGGLGGGGGAAGGKAAMDGGENKVVMGLQWPVAGGGDPNLAMDSGRDYWNGVGSSWHGLMNTSLM